MGNEKIILGQEVKDKISDFVGIATGRCEYLFGCPSIQVSSEEVRDGLPGKSVWINESQLTIAESKKNIGL